MSSFLYLPNVLVWTKLKLISNIFRTSYFRLDYHDDDIIRRYFVYAANIYMYMCFPQSSLKKLINT